MMLMLLGSAGIAAVIGSIVLAFVEPSAEANWWIRIGVLAAGIGGLWAFASSAWIDRRITRLTMWALDRYTSIDAHDYASLLHLGGDYVITELVVTLDHWLADRSLAVLDLRREGIMVLGVVRPDGEYLGVPTRETVLRPGDTLVLYSRAGQLAELDARRRGQDGDEARQHAVERAGRDRG